MNTSRRVVQSGHGAAQANPEISVARLRSALAEVVALGPDFLAGTVDADDMARHMVRAVRAYADGRDAGPGPGVAPATELAGHEVSELAAGLGEAYTCGSGYLSGRCDAACVMRTMTAMVDEFGDLVTTG